MYRSVAYLGATCRFFDSINIPQRPPAEAIIYMLNKGARVARVLISLLATSWYFNGVIMCVTFTASPIGLTLFNKKFNFTRAKVKLESICVRYHFHTSSSTIFHGCAHESKTALHISKRTSSTQRGAFSIYSIIKLSLLQFEFISSTSLASNVPQLPPQIHTTSHRCHHFFPNIARHTRCNNSFFFFKNFLRIEIREKSLVLGTWNHLISFLLNFC